MMPTAPHFSLHPPPMMRLHGSPLLLAVLLAAGSLPLRAQIDTGSDEEMLSRTTPRAPAVAADAARRRCVDVDPSRGMDVAAWVRKCRVVEWKPLRPADGAQFFSARYEWTDDDVVNGEHFARREAETVVFSRAADGKMKPEWHAVFDRDYYVSATPEVVPAPGGGALMSIVTCVNGTGGCAQAFLLRRIGVWTEVRQRWIDQLPRSMHGRFWKGAYVDPATLRGDAGLYDANDANCCPSHDLHVRVALVGSSLVLRSYTVGPPER
jgi:hypothetical protein